MGYKHSAECTENSGEATVEKVDLETVVEGSVVAEEGTDTTLDLSQKAEKGQETYVFTKVPKLNSRLGMGRQTYSNTTSPTKPQCCSITIEPPLGSQAGVTQLGKRAHFCIVDMALPLVDKSIEAGCLDFCLTIDTQPCGSSVCSCVPVAVIAGICLPDTAVESIAKRLDEYSQLCVSHHDCVKKGSGNFCTRSLYPNVPFGWCSHSNTEPLKGFLAMPV
ncbi:unnamed protein product [Sphenostylis stenocarpa]|uniref:Albumin I chain a domain-containing protein n=1 Tax=Sphenostylis stenocarpa TaxID=92480 RepID=A0AA86W6L7_9FABA|nr:unnamed protein product [Sphenostylis stenocarpa]